MEDANDPFFVPSERLAELRKFASVQKALSPYLQSAASFRVVLDTNFVLGDIRWMAFKRRNATARPSLLETIEAGTLEAYVPHALFDEMDEHIHRIAIEERLDHEMMIAVWTQYRTRLRVLEPDEQKLEISRAGVDPDDAPFVALAESIGADAIVSNDRHIRMMGGAQVSVAFVLSLRDYSRAAAIELHIKVAGASLAMISVGGIGALLKGGGLLASAVCKAPPWMKTLLLVAVVGCALHPRAREKVGDVLSALLEHAGELLPQFLAVISRAASTAGTHGEAARTALATAVAELERAAECVRQNSQATMALRDV